MKAFRELADHANEYLADRFISKAPIPGILDDYSKHGPDDWQKIVLYYLLLENDMHRPNLYSEVLDEITSIETEGQISEFLEIQSELCAVYIIKEETKWQDLLRFKKALKRAIEGGLT